jgi:hypothetical protein
MCRVEVITGLTTALCEWAVAGEEAHRYAKRNVSYCKKAARRARESGVDRECEDAQQVSMETASVLAVECPVCKKNRKNDELLEAARQRFEEARREYEGVEEWYKQACEDAHTVTKYVSFRLEATGNNLLTGCSKNLWIVEEIPEQ